MIILISLVNGRLCRTDLVEAYFCFIDNHDLMLEVDENANGLKLVTKTMI